jgi:vitamin B12 transporter
MPSIAIAAHRAALSRRSSLLALILASIPLLSLPAVAQQSASPDLTLPEVVVSPPVVRPRTQAPARQSPSAPPRTELPPDVAAPEANAPVVYSPTAIATPARDIASSVTVITAADIEREQRRTVPDALANVPGLNIVQTGGPGGQTSASCAAPIRTKSRCSSTASM